MSSWVQVMEWHWIGDEPFLETNADPDLWCYIMSPGPNQLTHKGFNTLRLRQNGCHLPDGIFKYIFLNENVWLLIKVSLKFVPKGPISNNTALVQIMAWRRPGDKSLSEPMVVTILTHICVTRPQWVNNSYSITNFGHRRLVISYHQQDITRTNAKQPINSKCK